MSGKRKSTQPTLAAFGFTKKIKHNSSLAEVVLPKSVNEEETKRFSCQYCQKHFVAKKGLVVHEQFCKDNVIDVSKK